MIVADSSAIVLGLLSDGDARHALAYEDIAVPHLIDSEVAHTFGRDVRLGRLDLQEATTALCRWAELGVRRYPAIGLWVRVWALRHNVSAYDATYVALAEALGCPLLTADARLAAAPGPTCSIAVVKG